MKKKTTENDTISFETFQEIKGYWLSQLKQDEPSCFNGIVRFRKWKVTIEPVEDPVEVLAERLEKLWVESNNIHNWDPLKAAANSIGYSFKGQRGSQRKN